MASHSQELPVNVTRSTPVSQLPTSVNLNHNSAHANTTGRTGSVIRTTHHQTYKPQAQKYDRDLSGSNTMPLASRNSNTHVRSQTHSYGQDHANKMAALTGNPYPAGDMILANLPSPGQEFSRQNHGHEPDFQARTSTQAHAQPQYENTMIKLMQPHTSSQAIVNVEVAPETQALLHDERLENKCTSAYQTSAFDRPNQKSDSPPNGSIETKDLLIQGNAFIERDYAHGHSRRVIFETEKHPERLSSRIESKVLVSCIKEINVIFSELNTVSFLSFLESVFLLFTCFSFSFGGLRLTKYDRKVERLLELIDRQNQDVFLPRGLQLLSPLRSGFRNLQIVIYDIEAYLPSPTIATTAPLPKLTNASHEQHLQFCDSTAV